MQPRDESALVAALARGDRAAAEEMVERTYRTVWAALFKLTGGDADLAADLTQETYRKAWVAVARFRGGSRLSTWLYRIAYTTFLNHIRKPRRLAAFEEGQDQALPDEGPLPDELLGSAADTERLRRAVLGLPGDLRFTVTGRFWGGQSAQEIAEQEGLTPAAVRKRLRKAYELLAVALRDSGAGEESE